MRLGLKKKVNKAIWDDWTVVGEYGYGRNYREVISGESDDESKELYIVLKLTIHREE